MADQEFILAPATVEVDFQIRPLDTNLNSIHILNQVGELSGFGEWVERTHNILTPQQRRTHKLVSQILMDAFWKDDHPDNFPDYLSMIAAMDAVQGRDHLLDMLFKKCEQFDIKVDASTDEILLEKQLFVDLIAQSIGQAYSKKGVELDLTLYEEAHDWLQKPTEMQQFVVDYLTYFWEEFLKDEWQRNIPIIEESVAAFKKLNFNNQTILEATRAVTGRDMSEHWSDLDTKANRVVFIPSAHIGPYNAYFIHEDTVYMFFGARLPHGVQKSTGALERSELLIRLSALADDTRLTILELLIQHEELCAQDFIEMLNLSQSSASRHLRQLTATGYITERRRDVAKCYTLNTERVDDTLKALKQFLRG